MVWKKNVVSKEAANHLVKEEDLNEKWTAWSLSNNTSLSKSVMTERYEVILNHSDTFNMLGAKKTNKKKKTRTNMQKL